jgi:hypothetical protein
MKTITDDILRKEIISKSKSIFKISVLERCREWEIIYHRQSLMYVLYENYDYTLERIGKMLCPEKPYKHCAVLHNINLVKRQVEYFPRDKNVAAWTEVIKSIFELNDNDQKEIKLLNRLIDMLPSDESEMIKNIKTRLGY